MCHFDLDIVSTFCVCHHGFGMTVPLLEFTLIGLCVYYTQTVWMRLKCCRGPVHVVLYATVCPLEYLLLVHSEMPI